LFRSQAVSEPVGRQFHVIVSDDLVLPDLAFEFTAFHESFRQVAIFAHLVRINGFAVGHESGLDSPRLRVFGIDPERNDLEAGVLEQLDECRPRIEDEMLGESVQQPALRAAKVSPAMATRSV